jgi:protein-S-isoprenylcysteine O-methyltransferase Ste14
MNKYINFHIKLQNIKYNKLTKNVLIFFAPLLFAFFVLLALSPAYHFYQKIDIPLGLSYPINLYLGVLTSILGLALYFWTIFLFSRVGGTQVPIVPTQNLVTNGPYAVTRNPMLTGTILFVVGLGIILNSLFFILVGMIAPLLYMIYVKLVEEKELEARFGEKYLRYKKRTPFIIPKLRYNLTRNENPNNRRK